MLRVAVIGAGHWGPNLIRTFSGQGSVVTRVVDVRTDRLEALKATFPNITFGTDALAAMSDSAVDAVVVATPTATHFELTRQALELGKHVLVEKPLATSGREAAVLGALASKMRRVLMVGHVYLFNPAVQRAKELLDEQALGRLSYLSMVRTNLGPVRTDVTAAWDLASHDLSIATYWLGSGPLTVSATGHSGAAFITLTYPNEVLVNIHCSWLTPRKVRDITVVGERRVLRFDDLDSKQPLSLFDSATGALGLPFVPQAEPLALEHAHFLECVAEGRTPLTDAALGLEVVKTLEAITTSMQAGGAQVRL